MSEGSDLPVGTSSGRLAPAADVRGGLVCGLTVAIVECTGALALGILPGRRVAHGFREEEVNA